MNMTILEIIGSLAWIFVLITGIREYRKWKIERSDFFVGRR